jgi:hypothetical protein
VFLGKITVSVFARIILLSITQIKIQFFSGEGLQILQRGSPDLKIALLTLYANKRANINS